VSTVFPKWTNQLPPMLAAGSLGGLCAVIGIVWYFFTPKYWEVGYMPTQPGGGFTHLIHAGKLGIDCRYCHSHVEESAEANIPTVSTCIGCHGANKLALSTDSSTPHYVKTQFIREAWAKDESIQWRRIHKLPDYVRNFPHNVHLNAGVSCYTCHGMIAREEVVHQAKSLSMSWCLDCHRNPTPNLVPRDKVTDLFWVEQQMATEGNPATPLLGSPGGKELLQQLSAKPLHLLPENCGACHF
jgi:hypothetical protein